MKINCKYTTSASLLALVVASGAFAPVASAQETLETVVVTATGTNISGIAPVGAASITMDRAEITATGLANSADIVRQLPQVQTIQSMGREGGTVNQGGNPTQGTAIDLRGLGTGATLTLINGRRIAPTGTAMTFTEGNLVPLAALDKIDILVDGASAVYGSDAVGGVVNFITRKDYEGIEANTRFTYAHGYEEFSASAVVGSTWKAKGFGDGNVIVTYEYGNRGSMTRGVQPFSRQDLRQYGGLDNRVSGSSVNPAVGSPMLITYDNSLPSGSQYNYYTVNSSYTGSVAPTVSQLTQITDLHSPQFLDSSDYSDFQGRVSRNQAVLMVNQTITPWLEFFYNGYYTFRKTKSATLSNGTEPVSINSYTAYAASDALTYPPPFFFPPVFARTVSTSTPWQVAGLIPAVQPGVNKTLNQYAVVNFGQSETTNFDKSLTQTFGFNAKLPYDWNGTGYFTYGLDFTCGVCQHGDNLDYTALQYYYTHDASGIAAFDSTGAPVAGITPAINPFSRSALTDTQRRLVYGDNLQYSRNMIDDFLVKFDGPLFDLPGGTVKMAVGGEYQWNTEHLHNGANRSPGSPNAFIPRTQYNSFLFEVRNGLARTVESVFAEVYIPVISPAMNIPYIKNLMVNAQFRYDNYSDFGDTTNPRVGMTWEVDDQFTLRGSWGTSFRAPTLTDMNPYVQSFRMVLPWYYGAFPNLSGDATLNGPNACPNNPAQNCPTIFMLTGNSMDAKPETSENWSTGFRYRPAWVDGLDLSVTYYNIAYSGKLSGPNIGLYLSSAANRAAYAPFIHAVSNPSNCAANPTSLDTLNLDPVLRNWLAKPSIYGWLPNPISDMCQVNVVFDGRTANLSAVHQRGIDFNINYYLDAAEYGSFSLGVGGSTILDYKQQAAPGQAYQQQLNGTYQAVRWRGRASVGWMLNNWSANLFANYVGGGKNTTPLNSTTKTDIPPFVSFDAGVNYHFDDSAWVGLRGIRLSFNAQNVFDQNPPITPMSGGSVVDLSRYYMNSFGRVLTFQLTKDF